MQGEIKFQKDLFDAGDQNKGTDQLLDIPMKSKKFVKDHFSGNEEKVLRMLDQEYSILIQSMEKLRRKLNVHLRRIELACPMKLYSMVSNNGEQDIQDEMVELSERYPVILCPFQDQNTFFRSFMFQFLVKLVFNNEEDSCKQIFKFLKKIQSIKKFECTFPTDIYSFKDTDFKCILSAFILRIHIFKIQEGLTSLEKIVKLYNDSPEVDTAAIIICKNLLLYRFNKLKDRITYKFLIEEDQLKIIPQVLTSFEENVTTSIIPLFVEVFKCNLIVLNDYRAEQPEYFIPQTKKTVNDDIFIYKAWSGVYYSAFEKSYASEFMSFCLNDFYLFRPELKDLAASLKLNLEQLRNDGNSLLMNALSSVQFYCTMNVLHNQGEKEEKRWVERVEIMEEQNKEKKVDALPTLYCCECERELSDSIPLLKFDMFYFCEACILDMIDNLNRKDKQFTYIGQSQVKRYQLKDAITELEKEREREREIDAKKSKGSKGASSLGGQDQDLFSELMIKPVSNQDQKTAEKKWEEMKTKCLKCGDTLCFPDELYLMKEINTQHEIAICITCLVYLYEQVRFTYKNVKLQQKFELNNATIKSEYQAFTREHHDQAKHHCVKCLNIRLHYYVIQNETKSQELKIICIQCFIEIFQHEERLVFFQIEDELKEQILDDIFAADYRDNVCVCCNKADASKNLTIKSLYNSLTRRNRTTMKKKVQKSDEAKDEKKKQFLGIIKKKQGAEKENRDEGEVEEVEENIKRLSRICQQCISLNVGNSRNPFMDYLISYKKLKTNIVYEYNSQVKMLIENDAKRKMMKQASTCSMCLRRLQDLLVMNANDERICQDCFITYRSDFRGGGGFVDGYECDAQYQEIILSEILTRLHDLTQCISCCERIKTLEYEVLKMQTGFSNVILCDNCLLSQLGDTIVDPRHPYVIRSNLLKENLTLQTKLEVGEKIHAYQKVRNIQHQKESGLTNTRDEGKSSDGQLGSPTLAESGLQNQSMSSLIQLPVDRQQFSSREYQLKCFNRSCQEVENATKKRIEIRFVKMPKCSCIFCIQCITAFYLKMTEARFKKRELAKKSSNPPGRLAKNQEGPTRNASQRVKPNNPSNQQDGDDQLYCPGALCDAKYTDYQIKDLANGYNLPVQYNEEDLKAEERITAQKKRDAEKTISFDSSSIICSICMRDTRPVVVMNDDYFSSSKPQNESEGTGFEEVQGLCSCQFSCKPCLFQLYYMDRCTRCQKKPSNHIYKILFNFKKWMKCPRCQEMRLTCIEQGPLITRTNTKFKCESCAMILTIE